jgi:adenylate cyclase
MHGPALEAARRSVAINPNFAYGHLRHGQVLTYCGRPAEAVEPIERSLRHSPFDPQLGAMIASLAMARYQMKDYAEAAVQAEAAIQHKFAAGYPILAAALARQGRIEDARRALPPHLMAKAIADTPRLATYANDADRDHFLGGVMMAGIGAEPAPENYPSVRGGVRSAG